MAWDKRKKRRWRQALYTYTRTPSYSISSWISSPSSTHSSSASPWLPRPIAHYLGYWWDFDTKMLFKDLPFQKTKNEIRFVFFYFFFLLKIRFKPVFPESFARRKLRFRSIAALPLVAFLNKITMAAEEDNFSLSLFLFLFSLLRFFSVFDFRR